MQKPNIKMVRVDERLIHGQGQLWIRNLGVNLVICANDAVANNSMQQTLMKTVIPKDVGVRFWTIEKTAEIIWKAAPHQSIFVIVESPEDALRLKESGFPLENLNIGNIHSGEGKERISQFIYLGEDNKAALKKLKESGVRFDTKTSPVSDDGVNDVEKILKAIEE